MRRCALIVLLVVGVAGGLVASAESIAGSARIDALEGGDKVRALIDEVVARQRALQSFKAHFVQRKSSALLLEPVTSNGELSFLAPGHVRWDYEAPDAMVVLFADDLMTTFHPDRKRAEVIKLSRRHRRFVRVLAGTQPLDDLTSQFAITLSDPGAPDPYRLTLEPTHSVIQKKLRSVVLEIDRGLLLPVVVQYNEVDGDSTRYEFSRLQLNPGLPEACFDLALDDDVVVETVDASSGLG